mgnify:CR=1 FL=1
MVKSAIECSSLEGITALKPDLTILGSSKSKPVSGEELETRRTTQRTSSRPLVVLLQELTPLLSNTMVRFTSSVDMED